MFGDDSRVDSVRESLLAPWAARFALWVNSSRVRAVQRLATFRPWSVFAWDRGMLKADAGDMKDGADGAAYICTVMSLRSPLRPSTFVALAALNLVACASNDGSPSMTTQNVEASSGVTSTTAPASVTPPPALSSSSAATTAAPVTSSAQTTSQPTSATSSTSATSAAMTTTAGATTSGAPTGGEASAETTTEPATSAPDGSGESTGAETTEGGGGEYNPCPTNDVCKILPFGDSITFGLGYDGGYRVHLFELAVQDNKNITFVGHSTMGDSGGDSGPQTVAGKPFPRANEGHSGWTISGSNGIAKRVPSPALDDDPHIVLLHIGTNDLYNTMMPTAEMPDRLGQLIDDVIAVVPDSLIVVAKLTPVSNASWTATLNTYNAAIPAIVEERAAAGKHVIMADMNTGFATSNLGDGVHPNEAGYDLMAERWYELIKDYLPTAP